MQEKTSDLQGTSAQVGLALNTQKTKILRINADTDEPVKIEGEELGEVESFTYLGSVMDKSGGTDAAYMSNTLNLSRVDFTRRRLSPIATGTGNGCMALDQWYRK